MSPFQNIKQIFNSDFLKHSSTLLSSNVISQIIAFVAYPIITRIYDPGIYGEFALFLTIATVLSTISTGKYELAILLPKSEQKASALFFLSNILNTLFFLFLLAIVFVGKSLLGDILIDKGSITSLLWLIPIFVFVTGLWQALNNYLLRQKKFGNIAGYNLTQTTVGTLSKIGLGLKQFLHKGLIVGQFVGLCMATLISFIIGRRSLKGLHKVSKDNLKEVAKEYANFPKYELPHQLINSLASNLPVLLLSLYFDKAYIGIFSIAFNIGFAPVSIFSKSISQVLFQRMSERKRDNKNIKDECIAFCKVCFFFILPLFALLLLLPESFFTFLFGDKWNGVTLYFKLLVPTFFMSLIVASLSFIPDVFLKQKTAVKIETVYILLKAIALLTGVFMQSFLLAIALYVGVVVLMLSVKLIWYLSIVKKYELTREIDD